MHSVVTIDRAIDPNYSTHSAHTCIIITHSHTVNKLRVAHTHTYNTVQVTYGIHTISSVVFIITFISVIMMTYLVQYYNLHPSVPLCA